MIKSFAIVSLLTSVALAQSSSPAPNPLIPTGISTGCNTFLNSLNDDASLTTCTSSLITATAAYGPGGNATASASTLTSTLNSLCSTSITSSCPESLIRGNLTEFYSACSVELTSNPNPDVVRIYDVLYTITPLKTAICSKDDGGKFCVTTTKSSGAESGVSGALKDGASSMTQPDIRASLVTPTVKRADVAALLPNITTYRNTNLPFLFLKSSLSTDALCTACTRNILTAYINFESSVPYAPGIAQSPLLAGQSDLYLGVQTKCGSNFLSGAVQAAGGLSGSSILSGAPRTAGGQLQGVVATMMGVVTLAVASFL